MRASLVVVAACLAAVLLAPPASLGAAPNTPYLVDGVQAPDPLAGGRWAERLAAAGDLTGDGVNDFFVAAPFHGALGMSATGRVYLLSGATRSVQYAIGSPQIQQGSKFGFAISVLGDVSGDGQDDLAVGTDAQKVGANDQQGKAWVFNGKTGALLYALDNPYPQAGNARFGSPVGRAGDLNGDGRSEVIVGAPGNDNPGNCSVQNPADCRPDEGETFIFDGYSGALLRRLNLPAEDRRSPCSPPGACEAFGLAVQGPGDVDGDGVTDQVVTAGGYDYYTGAGTACGTAEPNGCNENQGRMYLFSGKTGSLIRKLDDPEPQPEANFGFQDAAPLSPGDVDGDGRADVYANGFTQSNPANGADGIEEGLAWVFSGRTGAVLYKLEDPTPTRGGQFGFAMARTDYDKDGKPDLYVGQDPHHLTPNADQNGGTYVMSGRDGSPLKSFELPESDRQPTSPPGAGRGPNLGWSVAAPGDLNRDGEPDYVAGSPFLDVGDTPDQGRLYAFLSLASRDFPDPPAPPSEAVPAAPFAGCPALTANLIRGTAAANLITGTVMADRIFAGTGNDTVDALAGNDCVALEDGADRGEGGAGNDVMLGGLDTDRVSGGAGTDLLLGGQDDDRIEGGPGNDGAFGDHGNDSVLGGPGNDLLDGVSGDDRVVGGPGRDRIDGGSGNDRLDGGAGRDRLSGGSGKDRVAARDRQRDRISCGRGRDNVVADRIDRVARDCQRVRRR